MFSLCFFVCTTGSVPKVWKEIKLREVNKRTGDLAQNSVRTLVGPLHEQNSPNLQHGLSSRKTVETNT